MKNMFPRTALSLIVLATLAPATQAAFTPIGQPDASYTSSTNLISLSYIPEGTTPITSVTDGTQTVSFDVDMTKTMVGVDWATWNTPLAVESSTPQVLYNSPSNSFTMTLAVPSTTFGFELQGNDLVTSQFFVAFMDGATMAGYLDMPVSGNGGALLFAASSSTNTFTSVVVSSTSLNANGFAVANLRYTPVPEPASIAMAAQAIVAVGFYGWRKRRRNAPAR